MDVRNKVVGNNEEFYKRTLARLEKIQNHLDEAPRCGRLKDKVCIITGVGSLKGIGCVRSMLCERIRGLIGLGFVQESYRFAVCP